MYRTLIHTLLLTLVGLFLLIPTVSSGDKPVLYRDQVSVLMYHHIHDRDESSGTITPQLFRKQLEYLIDRGFQFITYREFVNYLEGGSIPHNAALVTFDDGYESYLKFAVPVLKELGIPAVNFIITETLDRPRDPKLPFLTRDQIAALSAESDMFEAQCHSHGLHNQSRDGPYLTTLLADPAGRRETREQYARRIAEDTRKCIASLDPLEDRPVDSIAYPYGAFTEEAIEIIRAQGVRYGFTIIPEMATRTVERMRIPRINAGSPYITPQFLYNTIIKRIVSVRDKFEYIPLGKTMRDIGGTIAVLSDGSLELGFKGRKAKCRANSPEVTVSDGRTLVLREPVKRKGNRHYMRLDDLQDVLGVHLTYNANSRRFSVRETPERQE